MKDTLTESVARLHRAGSEHSQQIKKLRAAADQLIEWLMKNIPTDFELPCGCTIYPSGEFQREKTENSEIFRLTKGTEHKLCYLQRFAHLIATDGFLDKLSEALQTESTKYKFTTNQINRFLTNP
jgi:hypothetical protein